MSQAIIEAQTGNSGTWRQQATVDNNSQVITRRMQDVSDRNGGARVRAIDSVTRSVIDIL